MQFRGHCQPSANNKHQVFSKLYNEDRTLKEERDKSFIENKFSNKIKEVLVCTFKPNLEDTKYWFSKSNSQTTGSMYDRSVLFKENQLKWAEEQQKLKEVEAQQQLVERHIQSLKYSRMYYDNMRIFNQNATWLMHDGVSVHLKRQQDAQKAKEEVKKILDTGYHRNVKRSKNPSRVTVPKKSNNRKYMKDAIDIIKTKAKPSPDTNKTLTSKGNQIRADLAFTSRP